MTMAAGAIFRRDGLFSAAYVELFRRAEGGGMADRDGDDDEVELATKTTAPRDFSSPATPRISSTMRFLNLTS